MKKVFIYPQPIEIDSIGNQYTRMQYEAFSAPDYQQIDHSFTGSRLFDLPLNLSANIFIFNWIENVRFYKCGILRFLYFAFWLHVIRLLNKKSVWVMHNKHPHLGQDRFVKWEQQILARYCSVVITHSEEGVRYFNELFPKFKGKCHYIPHPVYTQRLISKNHEKQWDYIIWGSIEPRKRVAEFLETTIGNKFYDDKRILVCGCCNDKKYAQQIQDCCHRGIMFRNDYIADAQLADLISKSRSILFTYNPESVLSSGALIYSLNFLVPIIGPNAGSFRDLKGIVETYNSFKDIPSITLQDNTEAIKRYIEVNTWDSFPQKLEAILNL